MTTIRRAILVLSLWMASTDLTAQSLTVRIDGDQLRIQVPQLHVLTGEPLRRLHDGVSMNYVFQATLVADRLGSVIRKAIFRIVVSYDIWEEKFAVTRLEPAPRSVSHLSIAAAEAACVEVLSLPIAGLGSDTPFWVRLEYRGDEALPPSNESKETGITLGGIVDIFSSKRPKDPIRGTIESGPFRLSDLRKTR